MNLFQLAIQNFKHYTKSYASLIVSLSFTILVFFNFENLRFSSTLSGLDPVNMERIDVVLQSVLIVLVVFMLSFLWYTNNVFLNRQKQEIGIYIFMGLSNTRIGLLYVFENALVALFSLGIGLGLGIMTSYLIAQIILAISGISLAISFSISPKAILQTSLYFGSIESLLILKGFIHIKRSSVLSLMNASKTKESTLQNTWILVLKALIGIFVLMTGYTLAIKSGGMEVFQYAISAVVCVIVGTYFLFGGSIPLLLLLLEKNKRFLFRKDRILWVHDLLFRINQNYRSYAIVCILMICSITALGSGFALNDRVKAMERYHTQYTVQMLSDQADQMQAYASKLPSIIEQSEIPIMNVDGKMVVPYSSIQDASIKKPNENEYVFLSHGILLSLLTDLSTRTLELGGQSLECIQDVREAKVGMIQDLDDLIVVNDALFDAWLSDHEVIYSYNFKLGESDTAQIESLKDVPDTLGMIQGEQGMKDQDWLKTLFAICLFLFFVFILAACSILFMKQCNDAYEDEERYQVLERLGVSKRILKDSIRKKMSFQYGFIFITMAISSYFALRAVGNVMNENLFVIYLLASIVSLLVFLASNILSIKAVQAIDLP